MGDETRHGAVEQYRLIRPKMEAFATRVEALIRDICDPLSLHIVSSRAKTEESFYQKAVRRSENGDFSYKNPIEEIEDMAGVRAICYTESQVNDVCDRIKSNFFVTEEIDKAQELIKTGRVGYVSRHFIVSIDQVRLALAEYAGYKDLKCEVQVRTVFQHAWAEIEHRLQYKASPDPELRSRFQALAGLVQVADREFEGVFRLRREIADKVEESVGIVESTDIDSAPEVENPGAHKLTQAAYMFGISPSELVKERQYSKAIQAYTQLIVTQPKQTWHYVGRAKAYALLGDLEGLSSDIAKIRALKSRDPRVKDIIEKLEKLRSGL